MLLHLTTARPWCDSHSTSVSACGVWTVRAEVQVSKKELRTHIHLDYARVKFLSYINKKNVATFMYTIYLMMSIDKGKIVNVNTHEYSIIKRRSK